jgi:geranylgeranyl diphosphate synthase type II
VNAADSGVVATTVAGIEPTAWQPRTDTPPKVLVGQDGDADSLRFLESIHRRKTGALFSAALALGGLLSGASKPQRDALATYARDIGLAFQVVDDILDHTAEEDALGKRVGKDAGRGKLTYPGLLGLQEARRLADRLIDSAKGQLAVFGTDAWRLTMLAEYVLSRSH